MANLGDPLFLGQKLHDTIARHRNPHCLAPRRRRHCRGRAGGAPNHRPARAGSTVGWCCLRGERGSPWASTPKAFVTKAARRALDSLWSLPRPALMPGEWVRAAPPGAGVRARAL